MAILARQQIASMACSRSGRSNSGLISIVGTWENICGSLRAPVVSLAAVLTLQVPFFYFSARDFPSQGAFWPMGVRKESGNPKPLRQDLAMGARTLNMSCGSGHVTVSSQEQLLAKLYNGCTLPGDYISTLTS